MTDLTESLRNPSRFTDVFQNMEDAADEIDKLTAERDALKDAAKLASRALNRIDAADIRLDIGERLSITKAIAALKAVL